MRHLGQGRSESFGRYYLRQIAMGEGCNCAESLVVQESARHAARRSPGGEGGLDPSAKPSMVARLLSLFRRKYPCP